MSLILLGFIPSTEGRVIRKELKWVCLCLVKRTFRESEKHFSWKHENIEFYTILTSTELGAHPLTSKEYFRGQKTFFQYESGYATFVTLSWLSDDLSYIF